jgi:hypothetical protein
MSGIARCGANFVWQPIDGDGREAWWPELERRALFDVVAPRAPLFRKFAASRCIGSALDVTGFAVGCRDRGVGRSTQRVAFRARDRFGCYRPVVSIEKCDRSGNPRVGWTCSIAHDLDECCKRCWCMCTSELLQFADNCRAATGIAAITLKKCAIAVSHA